MTEEFRTSYVPGGSGWITFPGAANWSNTGGWIAARYCKIGGNRVRVEGLPNRTGSTSSADATIGTLPAGFRPTALTPLSYIYSPTPGTWASNLIYVDASGNVVTKLAVAVGGAVSLFGEFSTD